MLSNLFHIENNLEGFHKLQAKLSQKGISIDALTVILEPTSTYHLEVVYWLYGQSATICLANPKDVHFFAKSLGRESKTDRLDCFALAQFGLTRKIRAWHPRSENIQKLDALIRCRTTIIRDRNRVENHLGCLSRIARETVSKYLEAELKLLKHQEAEINAEIRELIVNDDSLKVVNKKLQSIPGVGPVVTSLLIILFSNRDFRNGEQAAAFCGLVPKEYQSGTSIHGKARITKRGPSYIRSGLRMAAMSILTTKKKSLLKDYFERLIHAGKSKASALGALMHKLVLVAFAVWRDKRDYVYDLNQNKPCAADVTSPAQRPS